MASPSTTGARILTKAAGGAPIRPQSGRQRVREACRESLRRGEYPSLAWLRERLPDVGRSTILNSRIGFMYEIGAKSYGAEIEVDLDKLAAT